MVETCHCHFPIISALYYEMTHEGAQRFFGKTAHVSGIRSTLYILHIELISTDDKWMRDQNRYLFSLTISMGMHA